MSRAPLPSTAFPFCCPVLPPPARSSCFGNQLCFSPGSSATGPKTPCSATSELGQAPCTHTSSLHTHNLTTSTHKLTACKQPKPTVGVSPGAAGRPYHIFSVAVLPPSPHNEGQGAEGHLVSCHQNSLGIFFFIIFSLFLLPAHRIPAPRAQQPQERSSPSPAGRSPASCPARM